MSWDSLLELMQLRHRLIILPEDSQVVSSLQVMVLRRRWRCLCKKGILFSPTVYTWKKWRQITTNANNWAQLNLCSHEWDTEDSRGPRLLIAKNGNMETAVWGPLSTSFSFSLSLSVSLSLSLSPSPPRLCPSLCSFLNKFCLSPVCFVLCLLLVALAGVSL